jgi:hypothetical protein
MPARATAAGLGPVPDNPPAISGGRYLDPAVHPLLAFLDHREVEFCAGFEVAGKEALEHELVVPRVWQLAAGPADLGDAFRELGIVKKRVRLAVLAVGGCERPAGLGHWLDGDDAIRDAHP